MPPLKRLTVGKRQDAEEVVSETESGTLAFASPEALHGRQLLGLQKESSTDSGGKERLSGLLKSGGFGTELCFGDWKLEALACRRKEQQQIRG